MNKRKKDQSLIQAENLTKKKYPLKKNQPPLIGSINMINKIIELILSIAILVNIFNQNIQMAILLAVLLVLRKVTSKNDT